MNYAQEQNLVAMLQNDSHYQSLLCSLQDLSPDYEALKSSLLPENQELLDKYITLCEELEFRRTCLAYCLGTQDGALNSCVQFIDLFPSP